MLSIGKYSMSIYLLHDPILKFLIFQVLIDQESVSTLILAAVITLIMAVFITKLIEDPLRKCCQKNKLTNKKGIIIQWKCIFITFCYNWKCDEINKCIILYLIKQIRVFRVSNTYYMWSRRTFRANFTWPYLAVPWAPVRHDKWNIGLVRLVYSHCYLVGGWHSM